MAEPVILLVLLLLNSVVRNGVDRTTLFRVVPVQALLITTDSTAQMGTVLDHFEISK